MQLTENQEYMFGKPKKGSLEERAIWDKELRKKIYEGRKVAREDWLAMERWAQSAGAGAGAGQHAISAGRS